MMLNVLQYIAPTLFYKQITTTKNSLGDPYVAVYLPALYEASKSKEISEGVMEDIVCPNCGEELSEERLSKSLICQHCATNLKNKKYMDFLEFLMVAEIVDDIDFFDESVYGDEYLRFEESDFDDQDLPATQGESIDWDKDPDHTEEEWGEDNPNISRNKPWES